MLSNFQKAILIFILIILIVPFFMSKKIILWDAGRNFIKSNWFNKLIFSYAVFCEQSKKFLGLEDFFNKEHNFWINLKRSPIIFGKEFRKEELEEKVEKERVEKKEVQEEIKLKENQKEKLMEEEKKPIIKKEKLIIEGPIKVLIIGDSMMAVGGGVGDVLERELVKYGPIRVLRKGKVSSGLARPDYFNWELTILEILKEFKPNIFIIMIGLNDAQALTTPEGKVVINYVDFGKKKWNDEYAKRVDKIIEIFQEEKAFIFWIGLPVMKNSVFSEKMAHLNSIYEREVNKFENAFFVPSWDLFVDKDGKYVDYLPDQKGIMRRIRTKDGIHFQYFGGEILVKRVLDEIEKRVNLKKEE